MKITVLDPENPQFPDPECALEYPNGLLAVGGNLRSETLLAAYRAGIFPWYSDGEPVLWWSPTPRCVIAPGDLHISRSLLKTLRNRAYQVSSDKAFPAVISACASISRGDNGTWITAEMQNSYSLLHEAGHAHSVEVWDGNQLIGGLYGVAVGTLFCGESMFSLVRDASKIAFVHLCQTLFSNGFSLIDCQLANPHLESLGAQTIDRWRFLEKLAACRDIPCDWPEFSRLNW